jgi:hypothetical protein
VGASAMSLDETGAPLGTHPTLNHILSARDGDGRVTVRCTVVGMGSDRATREVGSLKGCAATREAALLDRFFPAPPLHMYERTSLLWAARALTGESRVQGVCIDEVLPPSAARTAGRSRGVKRRRS